MKRKPWILIVLALVHILAPVGSFIFNAVSSGRTFSEQWIYWTKVLPWPLMIIYVGLPVLAGLCIYICKKWSYYIYLACIATILVSNIFSFITHMNYLNLFLLLVVLLIDIFVVGYFMVPSVRKIYMDPRMRWWESKPRYFYDMTAQIDGSSVQITNISAGGLLFNSNYEFEVGKDFELQWTDNGVNYKVIGEVVYRVEKMSKIHNGLKFRDNETDKLKLKGLIDGLQRDGKIISDRLPTKEDGFVPWLKKVMTSGKGLVP